MPTEYGGDDTLPNTVQGRGPDGGRKLETHEAKRLGLLTGQEDDTLAPRKEGFMFGVDPDYPELDKNFVPLKGNS
jgi:hypothetical protein